MPSRSIRGEDVHHESSGTGPALFLVHSLGTASWLWREQVAHWGRSHHVVAADCRGHGASTFRGGAAIEDTARGFADLAEALDLNDIVIVGLSMGGVIAAHLQSMLPGRVRGLVLAGTFCRVPSSEERIAGIERKLAAEDMASFGRGYANETLTSPALAKHGAELAASIARTPKEAYLSTVRSLFMQDTRELLAAARCPVQVMVGEHDQRTPLTLSQEIVRTVAEGRLAVIAGAGHLSNLDQPQSFVATVDGFIAGL